MNNNANVQSQSVQSLGLTAQKERVIIEHKV